MITMIKPYEPPKHKGPMSIRYIETRSTTSFKSDIYHVDGDPDRWLSVTSLMFGSDGTMIEIWGQPRRMWDGMGVPYSKKGYRGSPPELTAEQQEALNLLFKKLGINPAAAQEAAQLSAGDWQI